MGFETVAVQDEDRPAQRGLAFAEPDQCVDLARIDRQRLCADRGQVDTQVSGCEPGDESLAGPICTAELDHRGHAVRRAIGPCMRDPVRELVV